MSELNNVVYVNHYRDEMDYLFSVPAGVRIRKGDMLLCQTRKGEQLGTAACDSFQVADDALEIIARHNTARLPLSPVVGKLRVERFAAEG